MYSKNVFEVIRNNEIKTVDRKLNKYKEDQLLDLL